MVDTPMPLTSHLSELRTRLLWSVVALAVGFVICYALAHPIVKALQSPWNLVGPRITVPLQIIAPAEGFLTYLKVGFVAGLFLVLPIILYQIWQFVAPGLLEHEIRYTIPFIIGSTGLFYSGGLVCYFMLPLINSFLLSFATGPIGAQLSVSAYVAFCIWLMIAFGLVFQMPMVIIFLAQLEIVSSYLLIHYFRYAVVCIFIIAAVLTPSTDPVSQTFMALPTLLLYGLSILAVKRIEKRRAAR